VAAAAEVVVDHLDDAGVAVDLRPGPHPGDPLAGRDQRPGERDHPDQHHRRREQRGVDAPAPLGPMGGTAARGRIRGVEAARGAAGAPPMEPGGHR
jgi:hypothetical protein